MSQPIDLLPKALPIVAPTLAHDVIQNWVTVLTPLMQSSGIITEHRIAMFLGQCAVESWAFTKLSEDLDYRADTISHEWPTRYPTAQDAAPLAHNPIALANAVYSGRMGNGDAASGDGWLFRGRGLMGTTGRDNYTALASAMKMDLADLLPWMETPPGAAKSACFYWTWRGLAHPADAWDVTGTTRLINGGTSNLSERIGACSKVLAALAAARPSAPVVVAQKPVMMPAPPPHEIAAELMAESPSTEDLNAAELNRVKGA
ncbi:MAG: glycoside hydrolase family 19 protein [Rhodopila sp.]|nr:glycoside hydrolase family 19 protein [Rhodopila sp.]